MGIHATDIAIQRQVQVIRSSLCHSQACTQDCIGTQFRFIGCAIQFDHLHIDLFLLAGIHPF